MFCKHCGNEIPDNSTFCVHCGKSQSISVTPIQNQSSNKQITKKKSRKKPILISILCIIFTVVIISIISNSGDGYDKLENYAWGSAAAPVLKDIGVQKIKEIRAESDLGIDIYITTEKNTLQLTVTKNHTGDYNVLTVDLKNDITTGESPKCYYCTETLLKDDTGRYIQTIYDYSTDEIIYTADEEAVLEHKRKVAKQMSDLNDYSNERKAKKKEEANKLLQNITSDYRNNEVAAENKYKGNTYTVSGTIQDIGLDVADNPYIVLSGELHVTFYFLRSEREEIAKLNKGDTIVITGKCDGAGVILDLTFSNCQVISDNEL